MSREPLPVEPMKTRAEATNARQPTHEEDSEEGEDEGEEGDREIEAVVALSHAEAMQLLINMIM